MRRALMIDMSLLPADVRKSLKSGNLGVFTGALLIQEKIADHFKKVARDEAALRHYKEQTGYCAGRITCMTFIGKDAKHKSCKACRIAFVHAHEGGGKNITSEYGHMQRARKQQRNK